MSDNIYTDYGFCPDCGEPRGVCACEQYRAADAAIEEMDDWGDYNSEDTEPLEERLVCPKCNGTGFYMGDCDECDHCDGLGYEWWLP